MPRSEVSFEWNGDEVLQEAVDATNAGLDACAASMANEAKKNVNRFVRNDPVQPAGGFLRNMTGTLFRALDWSPTDEPLTREVGVTDKDGADNYASIHEFGNETTPARPFMRRAVNKLEGKLEGIFSRRFREVFGGDS